MSAAGQGTPQLGSVITPEGVRKSLRLNPELAEAAKNGGLALVAVATDITEEEANRVIAESGVTLPSIGGGKRSYRGGDGEEKEDKVAIAKSIALMSLYSAGMLGKAAFEESN